MTRHLLPRHDPDSITEVAIGWDRPLRTYYAQVLTEDEDGEDVPLLWLGLTERVTNRYTVLDAVADYAAIPAGLAIQLARDPQLADQNLVMHW